MKSLRRHRCSKAHCVTLITTTLVLLWSATASRAEYHLSVDDVLEIAVAGIPDLKQRVAVQVDGTISFPVMGTITVAGLTAAQMRDRVRAALATKMFRQRTPDGRETATVIEPDQVTASVVEFRPIFVNGDVSKPGQQAYRPMMTVRQAVALAGGYELMRFRMTNNPFLESADLRSQYQAQWAEFIKEQAHVWRLRSELGNKGDIDQSILTAAPLPHSTVSAIVGNEAQQLEARRADQQGERNFLERKIVEANGQVAALTDQQDKEEQGVEQDQQELKKETELFGKGMVPSTRVVDARRAVLLSATRRLQTNVQLRQVQNARDEASRQLERNEQQRTMDLLHELQDATIKLTALSAALQSVEEKLHYTGLVRSQLVRGKGAQPDIAIVRKSDAGYERFSADEDFELNPGDVVEIALHDPLPPVPDQEQSNAQ